MEEVKEKEDMVLSFLLVHRQLPWLFYRIDGRKTIDEQGSTNLTAISGGLS